MAGNKNILLLVADDLGRCLGCYGDQTIKTPNIDRFAKQGTTFSRAFTSTASCSGSRSVIYTGLHTHQSGQYGLNNGRHHFTTFDNVETGPALFNSLGYLTGIIGKVHVGPKEVFPWQVREESDSRDVAWVADRGATFFSKAKIENRSFFLTIGYIDPHRDRTRDGFGNDDKFDERVKTVPYDPASVNVPEYLSDLPEIRHELASYYESISRLDQGVGLILDELKRSGLEDDTLVIFISDNGPPFLNSKTTLFDAGVLLPLLIRKPGSESNITNPNMVSFVDILPTCLDWVGSGNTKGKRLGRSLLPILERSNLSDGWEQQVFGSHTFHEITNYYPTRFMRTKRYKYHHNIEWRLNFPFAADLYGSLTWEAVRKNGSPYMLGPRSLASYIHRPREELYDLESDPHEINNLATKANEAQKEQLENMRRETERWQARTEDPWLYRDGQSVQLIKHHLQEGMQVPDRWEFDASNPAGNGYDTYKLHDEVEV